MADDGRAGGRAVAGRRWALLLATALLAACAAQRPVLYPNAHYKGVGPAAARADTDECIRLANVHGAGTSPGKRAVEEGVKGAVVGAATGAAVGAVVGDAGAGAAVGAAGGGTSQLARGLVDADRPDPIHRSFVDRCLRGLGYEPNGWR